MQFGPFKNAIALLGAGFLLAGAGFLALNAHAVPAAPVIMPSEVTYARTRNIVETASALATRSAKVVQKFQAMDLDNDDFSLMQLDALSVYINQLENSASHLGLTLLKLDLPVTDGNLSSPFGWRWGRLHQGMDFSAPYGSPIRAAQDGKVVSSGWDAGYGYMVTIEHTPGIETRYAHCSTALVGVGQSVRRGQMIARIGTTGHATGPHVHFELLVRDVNVNPARYLAQTPPRSEMASAITAHD